MDNTKLPVIVGFGGYNAAGRVSFHHAYKRIILESLDKDDQNSVVANLAVLMGLAQYQEGQYSLTDGTSMSLDQIGQSLRDTVEENTLIRKIDSDTFFDPDNLY